jgi:hypothetical protein
MKRAFPFLAAAVLVAVVWFLWPRRNDSELEPTPPTPSPVPASVPAPPPLSPRPSAGTPAPTAPADIPSLALTLNSPAHDIAADLRILHEVLDAFRSNFPRHGNPVGDNREITAALTGQNALRLALVPPKHPAINAAGELCDRWGTPFFFHAESGTRMEIRSAGPDKKLWTDDDVTLAP